MTESKSSSSKIIEVRFALSDPAYPFVGITKESDCRVELEKMLPRGSDRFAEFFSVAGADPEEILALAEANNLVEPRMITEYENGGLFEFVVSGFCPARDLATHGAIPREVIGENGEGHITVEISSDDDVAGIIETFLDNHPSATLVAKSSKDNATPLFTTEELQRTVDARLTDRQREVLLGAYEAGYYEQPSETSGEELADEFGIAPATLSQHLRAAERKLVSVFVQDNIITS